MNMDNIKSISKCIFFYIICFLGILLMFKLFMFYFPFLIAFVIAQLIEPIIKFLKNKTGLTRKTSSIIVLIVVSLLIITMVLWGIMLLLSETTNLLGGLNENLDKFMIKFQNLISYINLDKQNINKDIQSILQNAFTEFIDEASKFIKNYLTKFLNAISAVPTIIIYTIITILSTYFISSDKFYILDRMEYHFPKKWIGKVRENVHNITCSLGSYLKAEIIMIVISFFIVLVGLNIFSFAGLDIKYPVISAIAIGFVDALPILGSGTVLIPWSIISFINNDVRLGCALLGLYIFNLLAKQFIEPKIVSNKIGIHPIYTLIAMYTGFKFLGVIGLLAGPIILIILKNIFSNTIDKGLINSVLDKI